MVQTQERIVEEAVVSAQDGIFCRACGQPFCDYCRRCNVVGDGLCCICRHQMEIIGEGENEC